MPSTTYQTPGRWTEYYNAKKEKIGDIKELNETPPKNFETITGNLTLQPGELALEVATNPYNFILLSGTSASKKVQMVHHCFTTQDNDRSSLITGVAGDMKTAPLKSFYPREATADLATPRTSGRSSTTRTHIPSIEQFLTYITASMNLFNSTETTKTKRKSKISPTNPSCSGLTHQYFISLTGTEKSLPLMLE
jgi:hypothetical protein